MTISKYVWPDVREVPTTIFYYVADTQAELFGVFPPQGSLGYVIESTQAYFFNGNKWHLVDFQETKSTDEARVSTTTLANDSKLKFDMLANRKYRLAGKVFYDTNATADFKFGYAGPAGATLIRLSRKLVAPGTGFLDVTVDTTYATEISVAGSATTGYIEYDGIIHNGANAGTFAFQWAQNTSNAGATTVLAGSSLEHATF